MPRGKLRSIARGRRNVYEAHPQARSVVPHISHAETEEIMSWSASVIAVEQLELEAKLSSALQIAANSDAEAEAKEQAHVAIAVAVALAKTTGSKAVNVSLSGHANPSHEPREGYSNDFVSVSVTQASG